MKYEFRRCTALFFLVMGLGGIVGCGSAPAASDDAVMAMSARADETAVPTAVPTMPLPAVSVETLRDDSGYPAAAAQAASSAYPAGTGGGGLPAPVIMEETGPPPTPTPLATVPIPTPTTQATATPVPQPTFTPPALPQTSENDHFWLRRPIPDGGKVWTNKTYPYGSTRGGTLRTHHGVEFDVTYDTPVLATAAGTVIVAGSDVDAVYGPEADFYGNLVVLEHDFLYEGQPVYTLYGHLNSTTVAVGTAVDGGDPIGFSGASGVADGAHLHFEVRVGANDYASTRNPLLWLWPFPDRGTIAGRVTFDNGELAREAPVRISRVDSSGPSKVRTVTTYADDRVNGDDVWAENFALDDVPAGFYEVTVKVGAQEFTEEVWVYGRRMALVEIVIE